MWKAVQRAQRSIYPHRIRYSKLGVTGLFSLVALVLIVIAGWLLDLGGAREDVREFGAYARAQKRSPVETLVEAARSHRIVFLADIYGSTETKRLASEVIEAIVAGPGLDAVVVEVGHDQQPYLDRYFDRTPEDASVLVSHARTLREAGPGSRGYLDLYHRIWQLNEKLGADRRIQVIAADLEGWPPERALSTADRARRFSERDSAMVSNLEREVLANSPRSRILVFMTGLHGLKSGTGQLQTGGTAPVTVQWLAARLEERFPGDVHSTIVDAPGSGSMDELVPFTGTRLPAEAESVLPAGRYLLRVNDSFDFLSRPIRESAGPGLTFDILPRRYRLKDVVDDYIHLGN